MGQEIYKKSNNQEEDCLVSFEMLAQIMIHVADGMKFEIKKLGKN